MRNVIVWLDDEHFMLELYREALIENTHDKMVVMMSDVDKAWDYIRENRADIYGVVLDIIMDPGALFADEETHYGRETGLFFFEKLREEVPELPVAFLTCVTDLDMLFRVIDKPRVQVFKKIYDLPSEFAPHCAEFFRKCWRQLGKAVRA